MITATWANWSEKAAQILAGALNDCDIADLKKQVETSADLFEVKKDDELIGFYVLRIDALEKVNEGVIVAGAGVSKDFNIIDTLLPLIEEQFKNCSAIRVHTNRAGLIKKLNKMGYIPQEFVMRKNLNA
jgi:hypothetical protein